MHTAKLCITVTTCYELALPIAGEDPIKEINDVIRAEGWDPEQQATRVDSGMGCSVLHITGHPVVVQWREHVDSGPHGSPSRWSGHHISLIVGHEREGLSAGNVLAFLHACEDQGLEVVKTEGGVGARQFHVRLAQELSQETFMALVSHMSEEFATPPSDLSEYKIQRAQLNLRGAQ